MIEVVCAIIIDPQRGLFACRRAAHRHLGGLWEFPGGKIDPGETPAAALARELVEELDFDAGFDLDCQTTFTPVLFSYPERTIRLRPFRVEIARAETGPHIRPGEHDEARWVRPGDLRSLDWAEADVPVLVEIETRGLLK